MGCAVRATLRGTLGCRRSGGGAEAAHHPAGQAGLLDGGCLALSLQAAVGGRIGHAGSPLQPVPLLHPPAQEPARSHPVQTVPQDPSPGHYCRVFSWPGSASPLLPLKLAEPSPAPGSAGISCHPSCFVSPGPCQPPGCPGDATAPSLPQPALLGAQSSHPHCPFTLRCPSHPWQEGAQCATLNVPPPCWGLTGLWTPSGPCPDVPPVHSCCHLPLSHQKPQICSFSTMGGTQHQQSSPWVPPLSLPAQENPAGSTWPAAQPPQPHALAAPSSIPHTPPCPGAVPPQTTLSLQSLHSRRLSAFAAQR